MSKPHTHTLNGLLGHPDLQKLVAKTQTLVRWQNIIDAHLDKDLQPHCKVGAFSAGILTLVIDSSAFAMKLRYLQHSLLQELKKCAEFKALYKIEWVIAPLHTSPPPLPVQAHLSPDNAELLVDVANTCNDPLLQKALLQLAQHAMKPE